MFGDERLLWDSLNLLRSPMSGDERLLWDSLNLLRSPMTYLGPYVRGREAFMG